MQSTFLPNDLNLMMKTTAAAEL